MIRTSLPSGFGVTPGSQRRELDRSPEESDPSLADAVMFDRSGARDVARLWSARCDRGMVAAAHYRATRVGVDVLRRGGNAIDAAVATSLALSVVEAAGSGLGGMGIMTVHLSAGARTFALCGGCRAPRRATPEHYRASKRYTGHEAVAVPMLPALLETALARYGTFTRAAVIEPAIALCEEGVPITALQSHLVARHRKALARRSGGALFLEDGRVPAPGTRMHQPALAATLRRLADVGFRDVYEGEIARRIASDMQAHGGFVDEEDLRAVGVLPESPVVTGPFHGGRVHVPGRPAGGRTLVQMLNVLRALGTEHDVDTPAGAELLAAVIRRARRDRRRYRYERPDDPDLTDLAYAERIARSLRKALHETTRVRGVVRASTDDVQRSFGEGETTHLCVTDADGNAVSLTQSIERSFGAKEAAPGLGFLYNGYMRAFKVHDAAHPYALRPGVVARSNAAPTIVTREGRPWIVIGSTGSERMLSSIVGVMARLARHDPFTAVHAPRLHATPDDRLLIEGRWPPEARARLAARGDAMRVTDPYAFLFGGLQLVVVEGGVHEGVADPRRDGAAAGPVSA